MVYELNHDGEGGLWERSAAVNRIDRAQGLGGPGQWRTAEVVRQGVDPTGGLGCSLKHART